MFCLILHSTGFVIEIYNQLESHKGNCWTSSDSCLACQDEGGLQVRRLGVL